jgi:hypothetical protein
MDFLKLTNKAFIFVILSLGLYSGSVLADTVSLNYFTNECCTPKTWGASIAQMVNIINAAGLGNYADSSDLTSYLQALPANPNAIDPQGRLVIPTPANSDAVNLLESAIKWFSVEQNSIEDNTQIIASFLNNMTAGTLVAQNDLFNTLKNYNDTNIAKMATILGYSSVSDLSSQAKPNGLEQAIILVNKSYTEIVNALNNKIVQLESQS